MLTLLHATHANYSLITCYILSDQEENVKKNSQSIVKKQPCAKLKNVRMPGVPWIPYADAPWSLTGWKRQEAAAAGRLGSGRIQNIRRYYVR